MATGADQVVTGAMLKAAMVAAGRQVREDRDILSELDAAAGDGDLGATLSAGFTHVEEALADVAGDDVGAVITTAGTTLARKAPSTFGALLGGAFIRVGRQFKGAPALSADGVAALMSGLLDAVSERGGAVPGQRTLVDALDGGAAAAHEAATAGGSGPEVLVAAARGAEAAAERTADMTPEFGRAAWVSARAQGHRDAGAVAWAMYLTALAQAASRRAITYSKPHRARKERRDCELES